VSLPLHPVTGQPAGALDPMPVNLFVTTSSAVLVAPLPGVMAEHVQVVLTDDRLTIVAERAVDPDHDWVLHEWSPAGFERTVELPEGVGWPVTASVANGQLTVTLARRGTRPEGQAITIVPTAERRPGTETVSGVIDLRQADGPD
jgi:HSP20 family molecular chaperone IbpA